jgi:hypothetical protein
MNVNRFKNVEAKISAYLVKCSQHAASLLTYKNKIMLQKLTEDSVITKILSFAYLHIYFN